MDQQGDQENVLSASQDIFNVIEDVQDDAQEILEGIDPFDRSQQVANSVVNEAYRKNGMKSFLNRIKVINSSKTAKNHKSGCSFSIISKIFSISPSPRLKSSFRVFSPFVIISLFFLRFFFDLI